MKKYAHNPKLLGISVSELRMLFTFKPNPESITKIILFLVAAFLTPITLLGVLIGFKRSHMIFDFPQNKLPSLYPLKPRTRMAMVLGAIIAWIVVLLIMIIVVKLTPSNWLRGGGILIYTSINLVLSVFVVIWFNRWLVGVNNIAVDSNKHGTAKWLHPDDATEYIGKRGLYMGGNLAFADKGHMLVLGNTRSNKGTSLLIPNVLRLKNYAGSMVYIDIKAEAAAICSRVLQEQGYKVHVINPWDLLPGRIRGKSSYNPLDFLVAKNSTHLIDDVSMVAELIVEQKQDAGPNAFFIDSARNIISSLLLHLLTTEENPTLTTLWEWCRLDGEKWNELLADMAVNDDPTNGKAVRTSANAIAKQMESIETFSNIMSNVLQYTDFLKSSALQDSLVSDFDPNCLAEDGNTVVFVCCPIDKIKSHSQWLKLVTTTMMRCVVRKPGKHKVTFIADEAASALGYSTELEVCLAAYAGYNLSLILIYQDLPQIKTIFGNKWETVMANCAIQLVTSAKDNFTSEYISKAIGETTRVTYVKNKLGIITDSETSSRRLATATEVKQILNDEIIVFTKENEVTRVPKTPYYLMPEFKDADGSSRYDLNPYVENSL